jgi:hypothetical protein
MRVESNEYADYFQLYKHSRSRVQASEGKFHSSEIRVRFCAVSGKSLACAVVG